MVSHIAGPLQSLLEALKDPQRHSSSHYNSMLCLGVFNNSFDTCCCGFFFVKTSVKWNPVAKNLSFSTESICHCHCYCSPPLPVISFHNCCNLMKLFNVFLTLPTNCICLMPMSIFYLTLAMSFSLYLSLSNRCWHELFHLQAAGNWSWTWNKLI